MGEGFDPLGSAEVNGRAGTARHAPREQAKGGKAKPVRAEGELAGMEFARWLQALMPSVELSSELVTEAFHLADVDRNGIITENEYRRAKVRLRDSGAL
jgi:hypothetical protein